MKIFVFQTVFLVIFDWNSCFSCNSVTMFGQNTLFSQTNNNSFVGTTQGNPNKDSEVPGAPDDTIAGLAFSPANLSQNFLVSGSWDNQIRCWEITGNGGSWQSVPKAQQAHQGPVLDVRFNDVSLIFVPFFLLNS